MPVSKYIKDAIKEIGKRMRANDKPIPHRTPTIEKKNVSSNTGRMPTTLQEAGLPYMNRKQQQLLAKQIRKKIANQKKQKPKAKKGKKK